MRELDIISDRHATEWWKTFARNGWRKQEPDESPPEQSRWLRRSVMHALAEELISFEDAAELLGSEEGLPVPESVLQQRAFLSLPAEEQSRLLREQAEKSATDYQDNIHRGEAREDVARRKAN